MFITEKVFNDCAKAVSAQFGISLDYFFEILVLNEPDQWLRYIPDPPLRLQQKLVEINPGNIGLIRKSDQEIQDFVINIDPKYYNHIRNPTYQTQLALIKQDPANIARIRDEPEDLQHLALTHDIDLFNKISTPSKSVIERYSSYISGLSDDEKIKILKKYPENIKYITNQSERVQIALINIDSANASLYIKEFLPAAQLVFVRKYITAINAIRHPTKEALLLAYKLYGVGNYNARYIAIPRKLEGNERCSISNQPINDGDCYKLCENGDVFLFKYILMYKSYLKRNSDVYDDIYINSV